MEQQHPSTATPPHIMEQLARRKRKKPVKSSEPADGPMPVAKGSKKPRKKR